MQWVTLNVKSFNDFLELSDDDIESIIRSNDSMINMLARATKDLPWESVASKFSRFAGKLKDEISYLPEISAGEKDGAQQFLLKTARKMQKGELIQGFRWEIPPQDLFFDSPLPKEGKIQIKFIDGSLAAEGEVFKGKRVGEWMHFYEIGKLLAQGNYREDLKEGLWTFYYGSGEKRSEGRFSSDARNGEWRDWSRTGEETVSDWVEGKKQAT